MRVNESFHSFDLLCTAALLSTLMHTANHTVPVFWERSDDLTSWHVIAFLRKNN